MKLILSRKGFDSSAGGGPSPILPDGTLLSLPIPSTDACRYRDVAAPDGRPLSAVMAELGLPGGDGNCHLDPDLDRRARARRGGWRPAFGSIGAAGRHLQDQDVGPGDLFLFFGWFRPTRLEGGRLRFESGPDLHVLFGYLRVGAVLDPARKPVPAWLVGHPHAAPHRRDSTGNVIYVACGADGGGADAGLLSYHERRVLTAPGMSRSRWRLPPEVFAGKAITYHSPASWRDDHFQSAARGQEFVMEADPAVVRWAHEMIAH